MRINNFTKLLILIPIFSVQAQKGITVDFNIKTEPIEDGSINQTGVGMSFFKNIGTKNIVTNTLKYKNTAVTTEIKTFLSKNYIPDYSGTRFNAFEDTFTFSHQLTEKTKLTATVEPSANFESNFGISDVTIFGGIEFNYAFDSKNNIDLGVKRMAVFGKSEILPTFSFNHYFSKDAYLKLGFPNSELTYSSSIKNKFSLNNDFSGSRYNLDAPIISDSLNTISSVGFSQMESTFQYERNMDTFWYVSFKGGYSSKKEFLFSDENQSNEIKQSLKNGGVFSVSIKYKL